MSNIISSTDYAKLRKLAATHGERVRFGYKDNAGKVTSVDSKVDSTAIREGSILTNNKDKGFRRYSFANLQSDVEVGE